MALEITVKDGHLFTENKDLKINSSKILDELTNGLAIGQQQNAGALSTIVSDSIFSQQQNAGALSTIVSDSIFSQQQNAGALSTSVSAIVAGELAFAQQQNDGILFNPVSTTLADSVIISPNIHLEDSSENGDSCNFLTLEQFLKKETDLNSFHELLTSDIDTVVQIIKDYLQKCHANFKTKLIQSFLFVAILVSIFSPQFGGSRSLPVA